MYLSSHHGFVVKCGVIVLFLLTATLLGILLTNPAPAGFLLPAQKFSLNTEWIQQVRVPMTDSEKTKTFDLETPSKPHRYGRALAALEVYDEHAFEVARSAAGRKPIVVWNITRTCNLRCVHCYSDSECRRFRRSRQRRHSESRGHRLGQRRRARFCRLRSV